jgi:hypothetical protein
LQWEYGIGMISLELGCNGVEFVGSFIAGWLGVSLGSGVVERLQFKLLER